MTTPSGKAALIVSIVIAALLLVSCFGGTPSPQSPPGQANTTPAASSSIPSEDMAPVKIGLIFPLTGAGSDIGIMYRESAELAAEHLRQTGAVKRPIQLIFEDTQSDPKNAVTAMHKLISVQDVRIFVSVLSSHVMAIKPVAISEKVFFMADASHPNATGGPGSERIFRHVNRADEEAEQIGDFLKTKGITRAGILFGNDDYGQVFNNVLVKNLAASRIASTSESFDLKASDLRTELIKLARGTLTQGTRVGASAVASTASASEVERSEALVIAGFGPAVPIALKQLRELNYTGTTVIGVAFPLMGLSSLGETVNGAYHIDYAYEDTPGWKPFVGSFRLRYNKDPKQAQLFLFESIESLITAADRAATKTGRADPDAIAAVIRETTLFKGTYESFSFNEHGDAPVPVHVKRFIIPQVKPIPPGTSPTSPSASGQQSPSGQEPGIIKIGVSQPLTGPTSFVGPWIKNGIDMALSDMPESDRGRFQFIFEDDACNGKQAVTAITKLTSIDQVDYIIGPTCNAAFASVAETLREEDIIYLTTGVINEKLAKAGPNHFTVQPRVKHLMHKLAEHAYTSRGMRTMNVLYLDDEFGQESATHFEDKFTSLGGRINAKEKFAPSETDYRTQIAKLKAAPSDGLFAMSYGPFLINQLKQMKELGYQPPILGPTPVQDGKLLAAAGDLAEGITYPYPDENPKTPEQTRHERRYQAAYNISPEIYSATAYDSLTAIWKAVSSCGTDKGCARRQLSALDLHGVGGNIRLDDDGVGDRTILIKRIKNKGFEVAP